MLEFELPVISSDATTGDAMRLLMGRGVRALAVEGPGGLRLVTAAELSNAFDENIGTLRDIRAGRTIEGSPAHTGYVGHRSDEAGAGPTPFTVSGRTSTSVRVVSASERFYYAFHHAPPVCRCTQNLHLATRGDTLCQLCTSEVRCI